ncbi:MAG: CpaF family protein, partial [Eggerthellaceae bacterium]
DVEVRTPIASKEAISRLTTMVRYGVDLPVEVIELQIAEALDLVVQTNRDPAGKRYITEIVGYSYNAAEKRCETKSYFKRAFWHDQGTWRAFPSWLDTLPEFALATEEEVERWKQRASSAA